MYNIGMLHKGYIYVTQKIPDAYSPAHFFTFQKAS